MRFKIDLASLIVGSKFTVFALFYFVIEGNFPSPGGANIWRGDLTEGFLRYWFGGGLYLERLIHGGAYFWNFTKWYLSTTKEVEGSHPSTLSTNSHGRTTY